MRQQNNLIGLALLFTLPACGNGGGPPSSSAGGAGGMGGGPGVSSSSGSSGDSSASSAGGSAFGSSTSGSGTSGSSASGSSTSGSGASGSSASGSSSSGGSMGNDTFCDYGNVPSGTPPVPWVDNPALTPIDINPYGKPAKTIPGGYLLLSEGPNGATQVPQATQAAVLARINDDLKFVTAYTHTHMPPWTTAANGAHYIDYLFVGTGLPNDPGSGGDSSWEGKYPNVETTSIAMTDQSQRYDLTHEFFHVLENSYGTVPGPSVSWVQESYNDYLILRVAEHANGATPGQDAQFNLPQNIAYLDTLVYQQPYVPIESCGINGSSASVNGPGDYFTDTTGFRYNDLFPLFVAQRVGQYFYAAVWEQAKTTEQNLQTMTRLLDKPRVQCMIEEYGARVALGDFLELSKSIQQRSDAAMYAATKSQGGWLVPSDATKLPRYTGRNNIPITVDPGATKVSVDFAPDAAGSKGTPEDMRAQIVYRATDGTTVFSPAVAMGSTSIDLAKAPRNNVVIVVITNVTMGGYKTAKSYGWDPNETFGYKIQPTGGTPAPTTKTYF